VATYPTVVVTVTDDTGTTATWSGALTVDDLFEVQPPDVDYGGSTWGTSEFGPATLSPEQSDSLGIPTTSGGSGIVAWAATGLPDGITIDPSTGEIAGTAPATNGQYTADITATDADGQVYTTTFPVLVEPLIVLTTFNYVDIAWPVVSGGTGPYTFTVQYLPAGVEWDPENGGELSGWPIYDDPRFTLRVTDAWGQVGVDDLYITYEGPWRV
jgi:hypothetical protein